MMKVEGLRVRVRLKAVGPLNDRMSVLEFDFPRVETDHSSEDLVTLVGRDFVFHQVSPVSTDSRMSVDDAIDAVVSRDGRPHEWDWDAVEAAEVLASEVIKLRRRINTIK